MAFTWRSLGGGAAREQCEPKHIRSALGYLRSIQPKLSAGKDSREIFVNLVSIICLALRGYRFHVERLNTYVRETKEFRKGLQAYCTRQFPQIDA